MNSNLKTQSTLEIVTALLEKVQSGSYAAWAEFSAMHEEFKPFRNPAQPNLDWDLRIPQDIRDAFSTIARRLDHKASTPDAQATSDGKLWAAVAYWAKRYDALIIDRNHLYEARITANTLKNLHSAYRAGLLK